MTPQDGPITTEPRRRVEDLFVAMLAADTALEDLDIVAASNRDALVAPLHCFVLCRSAAPVLSVGQNYRCAVTIVVASNIDDNQDDERKAYAKAVLACLTRREPGLAGAEADARLLGWSIDDITQTDAGQTTGDRFDLTVAAYVAAG